VFRVDGGVDAVAEVEDVAGGVAGALEHLAGFARDRLG